jgi:hypothetical protein
MDEAAKKRRIGHRSREREINPDLRFSVEPQGSPSAASAESE